MVRASFCDGDRVSDEARRRTLLGVLAMIACSAIWGLSPLYYRLLGHLPPADILAHRTIWSFFLFFGVLVWQGRAGVLRRAVSDGRQLGWIFVAALMISVNWFLFIFAVQVERVTETSLGYYFFPLVSVLFGFLLFGERLSVVQWVAVALAGIAVLVLTVGLGAAPWISLVLALTFGTYGVLKKQVATGPVVSVTAEVLVLAPIAVIWLAVFSTSGVPDLATWALLVMTGPMTAGPLILFSYGAKRIRLATAGLLNYLNPTLQFLCAVTVLSEPFFLTHMIAFPLIWLALAMYSWSAIAQDRAARMASARDVTSGTV